MPENAVIDLEEKSLAEEVAVGKATEHKWWHRWFRTPGELRELGVVGINMRNARFLPSEGHHHSSESGQGIRGCTEQFDARI